MQSDHRQPRRRTIAQGVTADTGHALIGENATRALVYVAMTRGRHANTTHLYQSITGAGEYGSQLPSATNVAFRGHTRAAAGLLGTILAQRDQTSITALDYAALTARAAPPAGLRWLLERRTTSAHRRRATYQMWCAGAAHQAAPPAGPANATPGRIEIAIATEESNSDLARSRCQGLCLNVGDRHRHEARCVGLLRRLTVAVPTGCASRRLGTVPLGSAGPVRGRSCGPDRAAAVATQRGVRGHRRQR
jgi:hypothetical protein